MISWPVYSDWLFIFLIKIKKTMGTKLKIRGGRWEGKKWSRLWLAGFGWLGKLNVTFFTGFRDWTVKSQPGWKWLVLKGFKLVLRGKKAANICQVLILFIFHTFQVILMNSMKLCEKRQISWIMQFWVKSWNHVVVKFQMPW